MTNKEQELLDEVVRSIYERGYADGNKSGYERGYKQGIEDGNINNGTFAEKVKKAYENGANDAWECIDKIYDMVSARREEIFNETTTMLIISKYSASEAIAKIKEYEEQTDNNDDKIVHVGDEIYSELSDCKAVVQHIDTWGRYQCFGNEGDQFVISMETLNGYWVKTGKNYPQIEELLQEMQEEE